MGDNEIVKALECCIESDCDNCPWDEQTACNEYMRQDALNLINRQKAEVERLKAQCENTQIGYNFAKVEVERLKALLKEWKAAAYKCSDEKDEIYCNAIERVKTAKAEAYKEFAERLIEKRWDVPYETKNAHFVQVVDVGDIKDTLKELEGNNDG